MYARYEIVQVVDGRVFDEDWYERTEALDGGVDAPSGFYALLWPLEEQQRCASAGSLLGPFPNARVARFQARNVLTGVAVVEQATELRDQRLHSRGTPKGV